MVTPLALLSFYTRRPGKSVSLPKGRGPSGYEFHHPVGRPRFLERGHAPGPHDGVRSIRGDLDYRTERTSLTGRLRERSGERTSSRRWPIRRHRGRVLMLRLRSITGHLLLYALALALPILLMSGLIGW